MYLAIPILHAHSPGGTLWPRAVLVPVDIPRLQAMMSRAEEAQRLLDELQPPGGMLAISMVEQDALVLYDDPKLAFRPPEDGIRLLRDGQLADADLQRAREQTLDPAAFVSYAPYNVQWGASRVDAQHRDWTSIEVGLEEIEGMYIRLAHPEGDEDQDPEEQT